MIKIVFCLRRLPGLSLEEFRRYWLEEHGPLVRGHAKALGIARYAQIHTDFGPTTDWLAKGRGAPEPYDGVADVWFESFGAMRAAGTTEAGRAAGRALFEDEAKFIDFARSPIFVGAEHVMVG